MSVWAIANFFGALIPCIGAFATFLLVVFTVQTKCKRTKITLCLVCIAFLYVALFFTAYFFASTGIFHPLICDRRKSVTATSSGYSGIQTVNRANPEFEPYFMIIDAFDDPSVSVPSTYTELHDVDTCSMRNKKCVSRLSPAHQKMWIVLPLWHFHLLNGTSFARWCRPPFHFATQ